MFRESGAVYCAQSGPCLPGGEGAVFSGSPGGGGRRSGTAGLPAWGQSPADTLETVGKTGPASDEGPGAGGSACSVSGFFSRSQKAAGPVGQVSGQGLFPFVFSGRGGRSPAGSCGGDLERGNFSEGRRGFPREWGRLLKGWKGFPGGCGRLFKRRRCFSEGGDQQCGVPSGLDAALAVHGSGI